MGEYGFEEGGISFICQLSYLSVVSAETSSLRLPKEGLEAVSIDGVGKAPPGRGSIEQLG